ncbi:MAG: glycine zipper 2TM domain-containing protein [Halieaceae bacterium]
MKLTTTLILGALVFGSALSQAHHRDRDDNYGRVIEVEPVYRSYSRPINDSSCLRIDRAVPVRTSYTGTILGAVIGSALGHRIGDAHGDADAAAIAGGVLGASLGHNIDRRASYNQQLRVAGPCRVKQRHETVRELVEYKVTYRYNGKVHHARMNHDPGKWVKLNVDVSPA